MSMDIDRGCTPSPALPCVVGKVSAVSPGVAGGGGLALLGSLGALGSSGSGGARLMSMKGLSL